MKKQRLAWVLTAAMLAVSAGPAGTAAAESVTESAESAVTELEDGIYLATFTTDSSMFHVTEAHEDQGILLVENGEMLIHVALTSKNIVNLFPGLKEDAQKEGAELLEPVEETVMFDDGTEEEVNAFDIPVPALDTEFDLALIGTKGKWYDHKVKVSNPEPFEFGFDDADSWAESWAEYMEEDWTDSWADSWVDSWAEFMEEDDELPDDAGDEEAAQQVADLIDAIYVQEATDETAEQCAAAKEAWDALTDGQKELVEGEFADPDYFGRDTGDASQDDPLNGDDIGENELLVVSFGTSFNDSRAADIGGIEKALQEAYPDWSVRRAFTAQIIINHVLARDGEQIDNMEQALERAVANGVKNLVIQPTHLMHGAEYDELTGIAAEYEDRFESLKIAEPLLGEVGKDASEINEDKKAVAEIVTAEAAEEGTAFVFVGHGTSHTAKVTYSQMQTQMEELGYDNVLIGTVEGEPEETAVEEIIERAEEGGYKKVILRPLMVVAGDHANNDIGDVEDDESWISQFADSGAFEGVECQVAGIGRIKGIQDLYVAHAGAVIG